MLFGVDRGFPLPITDLNNRDVAGAIMFPNTMITVSEVIFLVFIELIIISLAV